MQNIIAAIFKNESEGYQAMTELRKQPIKDQMAIMQLALVKRENNTFKVCDSFDSGVNTTDDMLVGGIVGSLMGVLGGPIGVLLLGSYGALMGSALDMADAVNDEALIERVADKMVDGEIALIGLVEEANETALDNMLGKFDAEIARFDAAVIAEEVEEAIRVEKEMERLARIELRKARKDEFKGKLAARRAKIDESFKEFKAQFD